MIHFSGLPRQYKQLRKEILQETNSVYKTGRVLDGFYTRKFEEEIAKRCNRRFAVAVNSGTQALQFAQKVLLPSGKPNRILIPTISFVATLNSILMERNDPVFCDVDTQALLDLSTFEFPLDWSNIECVMYVNIFGNTIDYDLLKTNLFFCNKKVKIIEDAAQSFGASYGNMPSGSLGDVSVLSFDPTKNLGNYGSGGMLLTDSPELCNNLVSLRDNGKLLGHEMPGTNSKMSEVDCAQMLVKLRYFDAWQARRTQIADYYSKELKDIVNVPKTTKNSIHAWHKYVIKTPLRDNLQKFLTLHNIETKIHYESPLFMHPIGFNYINYYNGAFEQAREFSSQCLSLPIYPELTDSEIEKIIKNIKKFFN